MKLSVKVRPKARSEKVEKIGESQFLVCVHAPAQEGKANQAVVKLLSKFFDVPRNSIAILKGHSSKNKIIEIL